MKYKCWCCNNAVEIENDLCYDCETLSCENMCNV